MKYRSAFALCGLTITALSACTTPYFTMPPGSEAYRHGYYDGCDAGYTYAGSPMYSQTTIVAPTTAVIDYRTGWWSGFDNCRDSFQRIQRAVNMMFGPP